MLPCLRNLPTFTLAAGIAGLCLSGTGAWAQTQVITGQNGFTIDLVPTASLAANTAALASFDRAAAEWANALSDPITITINADLTAAGDTTTFNNPDIIGQTSAYFLEDNYDVVVGKLQSKFPTDPGILNLPDAAQFNATLPTGYSLYVDPMDGLQLGGTKADFKALGYDQATLDSEFGASDGSISFNGSFAFTYDDSSGVAAGTEDFQTVAAHEIGHILGFDSVVDNVDEAEAAHVTGSVIPNVLDLYRFSATNLPATASDYTTAARDFDPADTHGDTAVTQVTYDLTHTYGMSTGYNEGDGNQASHWKDDALTGQLIGVMDPTLSYGAIETVDSADLQAMHLIGYSEMSAPEPSALLFLGFIALPYGMTRFRNRAKSNAQNSKM